jgi:hypothetical protein
MVHPVHGADPEKMAHRTYPTLDPKGEIAVVQRPENVVKLVVYTGSGEKKKQHSELLLERQAAFNLAMEILQHVYRLGEAE